MTFDVEGDREIGLDDDLFVQMHIPKKAQQIEPSLFSTKWFDYRRMTPAQATGEYIKRYGEVYRDIYAREIDIRAAEHVKPPSMGTIMAGLVANESKAKRKLSGFWRGRQVADAMGMPYDIYIEHAFTYRMRRWQRAYLPQPEHLYHEWDVEKIQERWEEMQFARIYLPEDPAYLSQNYRGIPYQDDFHEWLFIQAAKRSNEHEILADMIARDRIPVDKVVNRLGEDAWEKIKSFI